MTKKELVKAVAEKYELTQKLAGDIVDSVFDTIADTVAAGESVAVHNFGIFSVKRREARKGVNPRTGEEMEFAAANAPIFKASKVFKSKVN